MDTSLVLQDPGFSASAGRSTLSSGSSDSSGRFASTLQQELTEPDGSTAAAASTPAAEPRTLRSDISEWLRSLQGTNAGSSTLQAAAADATAELAGTDHADSTAAAKDTDTATLPVGIRIAAAATAVATQAPDVAATDVPQATGALPLTAVVPVRPDAGDETKADDDAAPDSGADSLLLLEAAPTVIVPPANTAAPVTIAASAAGTSMPPLLKGQTAPSAHGITDIAASGQAANAAATAGSDVVTLPQAAGNHAAHTVTAGAPAAATPKTSWQAGGSKPGIDELMQLLQGSQTESIPRFVAPQTVLAPELDMTALQQQGLTLSALRQAEPQAASELRTTASADSGALPYTLHTDTLAGSEGWNEEIGSHISWLSEQKISKAELTLHPAELGVLDITINNEDERVTVSIVTRNEAARELLQDSLPRLADLLRSSGLALEQGSVSQQHAGQRDQGEAGQSGSGSSRDKEPDSSIPPQRLRSALLHQGQIDHYV